MNEKYNFFDVSIDGLDILPGQVNLIKITAAQTVATPEFRDLDLSVRKCRFLNEPDPDVPSSFKFYTEKACLFDCALNQTRERCGCTPWNFPVPDGVEREVCFGPKMKCFDTTFDG